MSFLNSGGILARHTQAVVTQITHLASGLPAQSECHDTLKPRRLQGLEYIGAITRCGDTQKHISTHSVGFYLTTEQLVVAIVISYCCKN